MVRVLVRGPKTPSTEQVAFMQASLPPTPKGDRLELRVRFVRIVNITAKGTLTYNDTERFEEAE